MKRLSLQWRLTLMAAALSAAACIALTVIISISANTKMDEITDLFLLDDNGNQIDADKINTIEIIPEYYNGIEDSKQTFHIQSILAMLGVIFISSVSTYFIAGSALKQLTKFSENIENIQAQNLSEPLHSEDFPQEIRRLSISFNEMLARLEQSFAAQKQFSANAAHELRTPLAVMQAKIEVFQKVEQHDTNEYQEVLHMLATQIERLSNLVTELLEMTELQTAEKRDSISLYELIEEVLCDLAFQAQQKEIHLEQEPGDAELLGNETLIYRAVFNLVENAIKYNHPGGKATVSIKKTPAYISVTVSDTGTGIPQEYHDSVFDPFFRVDKSRSREMGGAGIGLAMVKMIAELHDGNVSVENNSSGGSSFTITFPIN